MVNLSEIDKKIIYELSGNSRLTYKELAKKINSKKDTVAYHVNYLIDKKIITKFLPVFSLSKLDLLTYKIYFKLQGLDDLKEKEVYDFLINNNRIDWVCKVLGQWDLFVGVYCKSASEFSKIKDDLLSKFNDIIVNYIVIQMADQTISFQKDYLIARPVVYRKEFKFISGDKTISLDDTDLKIVDAIRNDGRFRYLEVSKKINVNEKTIRERLKKMKANGFLQGFTLFIDPSKIGYKVYKLCIYLKDHRKKEFDLLVDYLKLNPFTINLIKSIAPWELEVEIESDDVMKIYNYINIIKNKFPNIIKQIDLSIITSELKLNFFPEKYNLR